MDDNEQQFFDDEKAMRTPEETLASLTRGYLSDRQKWEDRQELFYKMRNHGLRRKSKPFPSAADLHYPLIDTVIEKLTPFYLQQLSGAALLADFIATDGSGKNEAALAEEAARYFDYELKQNSNFEDELEPLIDSMLLTGRSVLKIRWADDLGKVDFDVLDPLFFIVPTMTKRLQDAEFITEVVQYSPAQYKQIKVFRHDADFVERLSRKGDENGDGDETNDVKYTREGLTQPDGKTIVLWQTYRKEWVDETETTISEDPITGEVVEVEKTRKVRRVRVYTYAPHMPNEPVREPFTLPYEHDEYPFVDFPMEAKEKRWYSPRGIAEKLAPFEVYLCKTWNEKADAMTFFNAPIYTTNGSPVSNASNLKMTPGSVFTTALQRVDAGTPPISFDQEMINTRSAAEGLAQVPDFGMGRQTEISQRRTATEIQAISQMSGASQDARAQLFRKRLRQVYRQVWAILRDYKRGATLQYIQKGQVGEAPNEVMQREFDVAPAGTPNSWNKQYHAQVALQLLQLFRNDPNVNQMALVKNTIEAVSPEHLTDLVLDPIHEQIIKRILAELQQFEAQGGVVSPEVKRQALETIQEHFDVIKQANPQKAAQLAQVLQQMVQPAQPPQPQIPQGGVQQVNGGQM